MEFLHAAQAVGQAWPWFWPLVGAVLGGVLGSFIGCAWWRLPRGISLRQPPSQCMSCQTTLGIPDLLPVFSWLFLRGKCRHCGASIPVSALVLELVCAGAGALIAYILITV